MRILEPIRIGKLILKNRIEAAPAAPFIPWRGENGKKPLKLYYEGLASSGAAVVTLGISSLEPETEGPFAGMVRPACSPMKAEELPELVEAVRSKGALASVEYTAMKYMLGGGGFVNSLSRGEVRGLINSYAAQAKTARDAGFDMVMVHGGHGNVPAMFFARYMNNRTDEYGGSLINRSRFAVELLDAIRDAVGDELAIEYRISAEEMVPGSTGLEETLEFAALIQDKIDLLHVSRGLLEAEETLPYMFPPAYLPRGANLEYARAFKSALKIPVSVVGGFDLETAEAAVASGGADMVAMIRTVLADTACVANLMRGEPEKTRPCVRCNTCIDRTHTRRESVRCAVNPLLGREAEYGGPEPAAKPKKVVVIGGGPAGLEAARTAAGRGHRVVLLEKSGRLGGALVRASAADFKKDMRRYLEWSVRTALENKNIEVRLNTEADAAAVARLEPDAVIIAAGALPVLPRLETRPEKAVWIGDAETEPSLVGKRVVVAGAGFTGLEAALSFARKGRDVTVIDMLSEDKIGADGVAISMTWLRRELREAGVRFVCETKLEDAAAEGAVVSGRDGVRRLIPCDTIVLSLGVRPDASAVQALAGSAKEVYIVGDCGPDGGTLFKAVSGAFEAAMKL